MFNDRFLLKFCWLTGFTITSSFAIGATPALSATFSSSAAFLRLEEFNILPQNPDADSNREAIAFSGDSESIAEADADGTLFVSLEATQRVIESDFVSSVTGSGRDYFSVGVAESFASSSFFVSANETLSFDFTASLSLENTIESTSDASVNSFGNLYFALFDDVNNLSLGSFEAIANLDSNLAANIDNDFVFAESNLDVEITSFAKEEIFNGDRELASIDIAGNIQHTFIEATQARLQVETFNISCAQAPKVSNPCFQKVPEFNSIKALLITFGGCIVLYKVKKA